MEEVYDIQEARFLLIKLETILEERGYSPTLLDMARRAREIIEGHIAELDCVRVTPTTFSGSESLGKNYDDGHQQTR